MQPFLVMLDEECTVDHDCDRTLNYVSFGPSPDAAARKVKVTREHDGCSCQRTLAVAPMKVWEEVLPLSSEETSEGNENDAGALFSLFDTDNAVEIKLE